MIVAIATNNFVRGAITTIAIGPARVSNITYTNSEHIKSLKAPIPTLRSTLLTFDAVPFHYWPLDTHRYLINFLCSKQWLCILKINSPDNLQGLRLRDIKDTGIKAMKESDNGSFGVVFYQGLAGREASLRSLDTLLSFVLRGM